MRLVGLGAAAAIAIGVLGRAALSNHASAPRLKAPATDNSPISASELAALPSIPTIPSRWSKFSTQVSAGPSMEFTNDTRGYMIQGQGPQPRVDNGLSAGKAAFAWPGTSVASTNNGGRSWKTSLSVPTGIWSIDFPAPATGWAVGVESLYATRNGGNTWTQVGEPKGAHLVEVRFNSNGQGYGLDSSGALHRSLNGGGTWSAPLGSGRYLDLCGTGNSWMTADAKASIWRLDGAGAQRIFSPSTEVSTQLGASAQIALSCSGGIWETISQRGTSAGVAAGYLVFHESAGGTFHPVLSNGNLGADSAGPSLPSLQYGFEVGASRGGTAFLASRSTRSATVIVNKLDASGTQLSSKTLAGLPNLDGLPAFMTSAVQGFSILGDGRAWLKVESEIPSGGIQAPDPNRYMSIVYATTDAGRSWQMIYKSPVSKN